MSLLKWDWIHFTEGGAKLAVLTAAEPYKYCFEIKLVKFEKDVWDFDGPDVWEVVAPSSRVLEVHKDKQSAVDAAMAILAILKLKGEIE